MKILFFDEIKSQGWGGDIKVFQNNGRLEFKELTDTK